MSYALHVETSAPRAGRRFEPIQERELHSTALWACEALPGANRGLVVVPEFAGPIGIPDFTAYVGPTSWLRARQRLASVDPVTNEIDAGIISTAHSRKALTPDALALQLGWPMSAVGSGVRRLVRSGALVASKPGAYVRRSELAPGGRLYAVEAKVEDWRSALRQVRTYRVWADSYVLVMSGLSTRSIDALRHEVIRDRGGLVVDGTWLARPRIGNVQDRRRLQAAELFAASTERGLNDPALALAVHP